jgi:hypothetical protein
MSGEGEFGTDAITSPQKDLKNTTIEKVFTKKVYRQ